jgi:hypothetical protein
MTDCHIYRSRHGSIGAQGPSLASPPADRIAVCRTFFERIIIKIKEICSGGDNETMIGLQPDDNFGRRINKKARNRKGCADWLRRAWVQIKKKQMISRYKIFVTVIGIVGTMLANDSCQKASTT